MEHVGLTQEIPQDAQNGRPARPQRAKRRGVLSPVRRASERCENAAGGLFQHPDAGFTLVEVLVAIALLATIAAMVFGSLLTTTRLAEAGRDRAAQEQTIRRVLRVMADEISLSSHEKPFPWTGINGTLEGQPADTLAFLTMSEGTGGATTETIRVVYTRDGDRLMRFAKKNLYGLTDDSLDQLELADRVKGFNLRYFDGQSRIWIDEWPAAAKLPKALLLEVTFQQSDEPPWTVREWVTIGASS